MPDLCWFQGLSLICPCFSQVILLITEEWILKLLISWKAAVCIDCLAKKVFGLALPLYCFLGKQKMIKCTCKHLGWMHTHRGHVGFVRVLISIMWLTFLAWLLLGFFMKILLKDNYHIDPRHTLIKKWNYICSSFCLLKSCILQKNRMFETSNTTIFRFAHIKVQSTCGKLPTTSHKIDC